MPAGGVIALGSVSPPRLVRNWVTGEPCRLDVVTSFVQFGDLGGTTAGGPGRVPADSCSAAGGKSGTALGVPSTASVDAESDQTGTPVRPGGRVSPTREAPPGRSCSCMEKYDNNSHPTLALDVPAGRIPAEVVEAYKKAND